MGKGTGGSRTGEGEAAWGRKWGGGIQGLEPETWSLQREILGAAAPG